MCLWVKKYFHQNDKRTKASNGWNKPLLIFLLKRHHTKKLWRIIIRSSVFELRKLFIITRWLIPCVTRQMNWMDFRWRAAGVAFSVNTELCLVSTKDLFFSFLFRQMIMGSVSYHAIHLHLYVLCDKCMDCQEQPGRLSFPWEKRRDCIV